MGEHLRDALLRNTQRRKVCAGVEAVLEALPEDALARELLDVEMLEVPCSLDARDQLTRMVLSAGLFMRVGTPSSCGTDADRSV